MFYINRHISLIKFRTFRNTQRCVVQGHRNCDVLHVLARRQGAFAWMWRKILTSVNTTVIRLKILVEMSAPDPSLSSTISTAVGVDTDYRNAEHQSLFQLQES